MSIEHIQELSAQIMDSLLTMLDEIDALKAERDALAKELRHLTVINGPRKNPSDDWLQGFADACDAITKDAGDILARLERGELRKP